ncbi:MAG: hypothetical protein WA755_10295 [Candidatus Acidiferrales bacterium]
MPRIRKYQKRPGLRLLKFKAFYLESGKAYQSAKLAGYSESYAHSNSYELAQKVRVEVAEALRAQGRDEISQARKLKELQTAQTPKWNRRHETFQLFADNAIQLEATKEISRLLDIYPAKKSDGRDTRPVQLISPVGGFTAVLAAVGGLQNLAASSAIRDQQGDRRVPGSRVQIQATLTDSGSYSTGR